MQSFPFQYRLPRGVVPFSIIRGGISQVKPECRMDPPNDKSVNSLGELNWVLKNHDTDDVFSARQTHNRIGGEIVPTLQTEINLIPGSAYETLKISSPAPQAKLLRQSSPDAKGQPSQGIAAGTHIMTEHGEIPIESLTPGLRLITRDHGMQRLRWVGVSKILQNPGPLVRFKAGAINNCRDLLVCAHQQIVLKGADALMRFGKREVFASAKTFVNSTDVALETCQNQDFYHLLLDNHEVIYAEAAACESFAPSKFSLSALPLSARLDIHLLLPDLQNDPDSFGPMARPRVN